MNKTILFIAKTPYQLLVLTKIVLAKHKEDSVKLILCDTIANVDFVYEQLENINLFKEVKVYRIINHLKKCNALEKFLKCISYKFKTEEIWQEFRGYTAQFDEVYVSGIDAKCAYLLDKKAQKLKQNIKMHLFEDGFATYTSENQFLYEKLSLKDSKIIFGKKIMFSLMRNNYTHWDSINVFSPELLEWTPKCKVNEIESISSDDTDYLSIMDAIFKASNVIDEYGRQIIFFEEGYFADGINVPDVNAVNVIADVIGKETVMVKIHPRNPENRFEKMGFATNKNTSVPWEVLAQYIDLTDKTLVTIASQAVLMPLLMMNSKPKRIIMLMNCKEFQDVQLTPGLPVVKKIAKQYSKDVLLPNSFDELKKFLQ